MFTAKHRLKLSQLLSINSNNDSKSEHKLSTINAKSIAIQNTKHKHNKHNKNNKQNKLKSISISRCNQFSDSLQNRMNISQFRRINQYLYSHSSLEANHYLTRDMFNNYHHIYQQLVNEWPLKPINFIIDQINCYIDNIGEVNDDNGMRCVRIADIGCGNCPQIALSLKQRFHNISNCNIDVKSFDLISSCDEIIAANMSSLPINSEQCDYAVFCLSLMATNLKDCLREANRILKRKTGKLLIAEVLSRFEQITIETFQSRLRRYGFKLIRKQLLPPNQYFVYFEFQKYQNCWSSDSSVHQLPDISLKACVYKPR